VTTKFAKVYRTVGSKTPSCLNGPVKGARYGLSDRVGLVSFAINFFLASARFCAPLHDVTTLEEFAHFVLLL
jgi:hypothetical protein